MLLVDDHVGDDDSDDDDDGGGGGPEDDYYCDDCTVDNEKPKETKDFDETDDQLPREDKLRHYDYSRRRGE